MAAQVLLIVIDILVVVAISIGVGALAPRWPDACSTVTVDR